MKVNNANIKVKRNYINDINNKNYKDYGISNTTLLSDKGHCYS